MSQFPGWVGQDRELHSHTAGFGLVREKAQRHVTEETVLMLAPQPTGSVTFSGWQPRWMSAAR